MDSGRTIYKGGCYCGLFVYESRLSETQAAYKCNCSLCAKKGYLWLFPGPDNFMVVKGSEDSLTTYKFGPKKLSHKFCPTCGRSCFACTKGDDPEFDLALHAHAVVGLDTACLDHTPFDGASAGDAYIKPCHNGLLPTKMLRNDKIYTGSCHCGALTLAANVPLGGQRSASVSASRRYRFSDLSECVWVTPKSGQAVIAGDAASIVRYTKRDDSLLFCKNCGVHMAIEEINAKVEDERELHEVGSQKEQGLGVIGAINARVLHDVDPFARKQLDL